jgi:hypothetical protein
MFTHFTQTRPFERPPEPSGGLARRARFPEDDLPEHFGNALPPLVGQAQEDFLLLGRKADVQYGIALLLRGFSSRVHNAAEYTQTFHICKALVCRPPDVEMFRKIYALAGPSGNISAMSAASSASAVLRRNLFSINGRTL